MKYITISLPVEHLHLIDDALLRADLNAAHIASAYARDAEQYPDNNYFTTMAQETANDEQNTRHAVNILLDAIADGITNSNINPFTLSEVA